MENSVFFGTESEALVRRLCAIHFSKKLTEFDIKGFKMASSLQ